MNIYIDGTVLLRPVDGVGSLSASLLTHLVEIRPESKYIILGFKDDDIKQSLLPDNPAISYELLPMKRRTYRAKFKFLSPKPVNKFLKLKPDFVIYPDFVANPYISDVAGLAFVHDMVHADMPEVVDDKNTKYLNKFIPWTLESGFRLATTTKFVATSMAKHLGTSISTTPLIAPGVSEAKTITEQEKNTTLDKYSLSEGYIFFLGSQQPRKNLERLLNAYSELSDSVTKNHPLVLAGGSGWKNDSIQQKIEELKQKGLPVRNLGRIDESEKPALYAGARMFAFPSLYEGFGLVILEAMSYGVPVLTSKTTALPEAAGDAAWQVDPHSVKAIKQGLEQLCLDERTRQDLSQKGITRAKSFSWSKGAEQLAESIEIIGKSRL